MNMLVIDGKESTAKVAVIRSIAMIGKVYSHNCVFYKMCAIDN